MEKVSARAENPSPVSETELGFSARAKGLNSQKSYVIEMECLPGQKRQREHGYDLGNKMAAKEKRFQWNKCDKIENRIRCLANFKAKMEYKNSNFNADKVKQYEGVREAMARIYEDQPTFFGAPVITPLPAPSDQIDQEEMAEISFLALRLIFEHGLKFFM